MPIELTKTSEDNIIASVAIFQDGKTNFSSIPETDSLTSLNITEKIDGKVTINEYQAQKGNGYEIIFRKTDGIDEYYKVVAYGPEDKNRNQDWVKFIKEPSSNIKK